MSLKGTKAALSQLLTIRIQDRLSASTDSPRSLTFNNLSKINWGHAVAYLVEALRYKSEGRGFDSRWCHWNFSLTKSFRPQYGPGVDSASNRNEYQGCFLGVKAVGA